MSNNYNFDIIYVDPDNKNFTGFKYSEISNSIDFLVLIIKINSKFSHNSIINLFKVNLKNFIYKSSQNIQQIARFEGGIHLFVNKKTQSEIIFNTDKIVFNYEFMYDFKSQTKNFYMKSPICVSIININGLAPLCFINVNFIPQTFKFMIASSKNDNDDRYNYTQYIHETFRMIKNIIKTLKKNLVNDNYYLQEPYINYICGNLGIYYYKNRNIEQILNIDPILNKFNSSLIDNFKQFASKGYIKNNSEKYIKEISGTEFSYIPYRIIFLENKNYPSRFYVKQETIDINKGYLINNINIINNNLNETFSFNRNVSLIDCSNNNIKGVKSIEDIINDILINQHKPKSFWINFFDKFKTLSINEDFNKVLRKFINDLYSSEKEINNSYYNFLDCYDTNNYICGKYSDKNENSENNTDLDEIIKVNSTDLKDSDNKVKIFKKLWFFKNEDFLKDVGGYHLYDDELNCDTKKLPKNVFMINKLYLDMLVFDEIGKTDDKVVILNTTLYEKFNTYDYSYDLYTDKNSLKIDDYMNKIYPANDDNFLKNDLKVFGNPKTYPSYKEYYSQIIINNINIIFSDFFIKHIKLKTLDKLIQKYIFNKLFIDNILDETNINAIFGEVSKNSIVLTHIDNLLKNK